MLSVAKHDAIAERPVQDVDHDRRDVKPIADHLHDRAPVLNERRQDRRIAMVERRHPVERVGQRAEAEPDRQHPLAIARTRVARRADDAVLQEDAQRVGGALDFRRHRHQKARALARVDHLLRAQRARRKQPFVAVDAAELRIEKRALEVNAETPRADRDVLLELMRRLDDLGRCVQHRFPRRRHDGGDEPGRAVRGIGGAGDGDRVSLIAIEQHVGGAVGVDVDQSRRDRAARRQRTIVSDRRPRGRPRSGRSRRRSVRTSTRRRRRR